MDKTLGPYIWCTLNPLFRWYWERVDRDHGKVIIQLQPRLSRMMYQKSFIFETEKPHSNLKECEKLYFYGKKLVKIDMGIEYVLPDLCYRQECDLNFVFKPDRSSRLTK